MTSAIPHFMSGGVAAATAGSGAIPTWAWRASDLALAPYRGSGTPTIARAGNTATRINSSGLIETVNANLARYDYSLAGVLQGLLVEPAATNIALHNNDQTNAAWVKGATMTAAKDQTGPDGVANSASLLTGGAVSATNTSLQTVVLASSSRLMSAYIKRVTGTGTIEMTTDGGTSWVAVVPTSSWARYSIPAQTVTNPVFGFRITTSTDAIAVAFVQNETGVLTSPTTETGAAAVARAADAITLATASLTGFSATAGTLVMHGTLPGSTGTINVLGSIKGADGEEFNLYRDAGDQPLYNVADGAVTQATNNLGAVLTSGSLKMAGAWAANDFVGARDGTLGTPDTSGTLPTVTTFYIGAYNATLHWRGHISEIKYYNTRLPNATLQALTQ
jgi:hypothetical protein